MVYGLTAVEVYKLCKGREETIMKQIITFIKQETVLAVAIVLALLSMLAVPPDGGYVSYIDFRTLAILFCLMTIVAGLRKIGVFDWMAEGMLAKVSSTAGIVTILVLFSFFLSMFITNDVALITFVPLAIILMNRMPEKIRQKWLIRCAVMQTIAANLGSMLTPVGNPQNLYLYGKVGMNIFSFIKLMLPYTVVSLILLLVWIGLCALREKFAQTDRTKRICTPEEKQQIPKAQNYKKTSPEPGFNREYLIAYLFLFLLSLAAVAHVLPYPLLFVAVLLYVLLRNRALFGEVDYSLLGTFAALFIFIGNFGRIPQFSSFLQQFIQGRERLTAVVASQVMSNVPAAILLSGFTDRYQELIIGTNLGGLGTLIASMASLISFKYIAWELPGKKGTYLVIFTAANVLFLSVLLLVP